MINSIFWDWKHSVSPYLEGEGEWLCRPYCLSHSSLSFSRRSRSLNVRPQGQTIATQIPSSRFQHTQAYFIRILRAMARSSPSRSCKINKEQWGEMDDEEACVSALISPTNTHLPFVFLLLDFHLSSFLIRLGCRSGKKPNTWKHTEFSREQKVVLGDFFYLHNFHQRVTDQHVHLWGLKYLAHI